MKSNIKTKIKNTVNAIIILLTITIFACTKDAASTAPATPHSESWTIMVYMNGDNSLSGYVAVDLAEMKSVNLSATNVKVIALTDLAGDNNTKLYKVNYNALEKLSSTELGLTADGTEELNLGDYNTLNNFIDFCKNTYPSDNYAVVIWNHGSGWRNTTTAPVNGFQTAPYVPTEKYTPSSFRAISQDETSGGDAILTHQLGLVFKDKGINVIGFDACLMGMIEVFYELRNHAEYCIASSDLIAANGWNYNKWLTKFIYSNGSSLALTVKAVEAYKETYSNSTRATLAGIDLSQIDNLMLKLNAFSTKLASCIINTATQNEIASAILSSTEEFYDPFDYNIDIYSMAENVKSATDYADAEADELITAIENTVVSSFHDTTLNPKSHGISIHFIRADLDGSILNPAHDDAYFSNYAGTNPLEFVQNSTWVPGSADNLLQKLIYTTY